MEEKVSQIVHTGMTDLLESSYNLFWKHSSNKKFTEKSKNLENEIAQFTIFLEEVDAHVSDIDSDC